MLRGPKTLVVLADGERARFLTGVGRCRSFQRVGPGEMIDPAAGLPDRALASDKPGRTFAPSDGRRATMENTDFHRREKQLFARSVAETLEKIAGNGAYDRLILVAPPTALGELRANLSKQMTERITGEVPKDLTKVRDDQVRAHLEDVLPP